MPYVKETAIVGGKEISIETGKWAKQAGGSVVVRCGGLDGPGHRRPVRSCPATSTSCR
jgi:hypothetical protein